MSNPGPLPGLADPASAYPSQAERQAKGFSTLTARYGLSAGVTNVVELACRGLECKEIASALGLSESTIKKKLTAASRRLQARGRGHLCALSGMVASGLELEEAQAMLHAHGALPGR